MSSRGDSKQPGGSKLASITLPFPWKLFQCLEDSEKNGTDHILRWCEEGRSFSVYKPSDFTGKIMADYFNFGSYKSFLHELSRYGFVEQQAGSFSHPRFLRHDKNSCLSLRRSPTKRKLGKSSSSSPLISTIAERQNRKGSTPEKQETCEPSSDVSRRGYQKPLETHDNELFRPVERHNSWPAMRSTNTLNYLHSFLPQKSELFLSKADNKLLTPIPEDDKSNQVVKRSTSSPDLVNFALWAEKGGIGVGSDNHSDFLEPKPIEQMIGETKQQQKQSEPLGFELHDIVLEPKPIEQMIRCSKSSHGNL